jgi:aspartyl-tRNA(Asn)/glutamyl-tRNA(Gln) amidotransferase subunit A
MRGVPNTCGSRMLEGWVPPYDATVTERLRAADVVVLGKTNMDEFAMGSSTENSAFGPTRNPWDLDRVPGGSSGGSAAAVAAGMAPLAIGTDTGGSIRQPAAFTGIVGAKPTYGSVSRYGLVAFASSLDQAGPFARDVTDTALLQSVIQGHDPRDATSDPSAARPLADAARRVEGMRIGVVEELEAAGCEPGVRPCSSRRSRARAARRAHRARSRSRTSPTACPRTTSSRPAEASSNLARFDGVRYGLRVDAESAEAMNAATRGAGFGPEVRRRIMIGTHALSSGYVDAYYLQAARVRTLIARDYAAAFERSTCSSARPRRRCRSGSVSAPPTRSRCTATTSRPCRPRSPGSRRSRSRSARRARRAARVRCPSACRSWRRCARTRATTASRSRSSRRSASTPTLPRTVRGQRPSSGRCA